MTLCKLSLRNARRQAGDYLVYFVTIIMVAALVYAFNGLIFSEEIQKLSRLMKALPLVVVLASIVIVCIISWLVSYTTNFMLNCRSRELGTYILIGMENRQVARLFFLENLVVGGCALVLGILVGNLLFQVLRAIILALFGIVYTFSLSFCKKAVGLTLFYFICIYMLSQLRSHRRIRSIKIYDLIYLERQNEDAVIRKSGRRKKIFAVSLILGMTGTLLIMAGKLLFGIIGSGCIIAFLYGFFTSFSSGVPGWFEKHAAQKYRGWTLLVFRGLSAKLATMGVAMATVSLLFTATLVSEGAGLTFRAILQGRSAREGCFDLLLSSEERGMERLAECMDYISVNIPVEASRQYQIYLGETSEITDYILANTKYYADYPKDTLMRAGDYAALREMLGYPAVTVGEGQYLIHCEPYVEAVLKDWSRPLAVGGYTLAPGGIHTEVFAQSMFHVNGDGFLLVVPDEAAEACPVSHSIYAAQTVERLSREQYDVLERMMDEGGFDLGLALYAKSAQEGETASVTAMMVFPLYYLSLALTMTAATILTIQQLSEAARYRWQFSLLRKLGMERREMIKTLRIQCAIYYAMPAVPPVLIGVAFILNLGEGVEPGTLVGAGRPVVIAGMTLGIFFLIYTVYILLAYTGLKRNVIPD